jgi:hypothetical protein
MMKGFTDRLAQLRGVKCQAVDAEEYETRGSEPIFAVGPSIRFADGTKLRAQFWRLTKAGSPASFVGIERVGGSIGGKKGTFLLQVRGTVVGREMGAEWFVIPGSGTVELRGLRGEVKAELGHHGTIWLDYYFEATAANQVTCSAGWRIR